MSGVLDGSLTRDPAGWRGLGNISEAEIAAVYPLADGEARAVRGQERRHYRVRSLVWRGFDEPFSLFFDGARLVILETDYWSLDEDRCARTLKALGPPQKRLDAAFRMSRIPKGEYVYHDRGLALSVIPDTGLIVRWTTFAPTTPDEYRRYIRATALAQEFETETG
jgi:hypothetical protein